jgi:hypothetical protein
MATPICGKKHIVMESLNMTSTMATPMCGKKHISILEMCKGSHLIFLSLREIYTTRAFTLYFFVSEKYTLQGLSPHISPFLHLREIYTTTNLHDHVTPSEAPSTCINLLTSSSKIACNACLRGTVSNAHLWHY